jgi:hypothetical protein
VGKPLTPAQYLFFLIKIIIMDKSFSRTEQEEEKRRQDTIVPTTDSDKKVSSDRTVIIDDESHANEDYLKEKQCAPNVGEELKNNPTPD